jgi:hypothetical protein
MVGHPHPGIAELYPQYPERDRAGFGFFVPQTARGPHTLTLTLVAQDGGASVLKRQIRVR